MFLELVTLSLVLTLGSTQQTLMMDQFIDFDEPDCPIKVPYECEKYMKYRSYDGTCNNLDHPKWGSNSNCVSRLLPPDYGEDPTGYKSIRMAKSGKPLRNERLISNEYLKDRGQNDTVCSHLMMSFGQFITEIISKVTEPRRNLFDLEFGAQQFPCCTTNGPIPKWCSPIAISKQDQFYGEFNLTCFNNFRSQECDHCTATPGNPKIRKQKNEKMNYLALASLYGESDGDNILLRQKKGGRLITSQDANKKLVLPRTYDLPSRTSSSESCDPRLVGVCFK